MASSVVIEDVTDEPQESASNHHETASSGAEASGTANNVAAPIAEEPNALAKAESPAPLSAEDLQKLSEAEALKQDGNQLYAKGDVEGAVAKYGEALRTAPEAAAQQRAVYFANLAACHLKSGHHEDAVQDAACALELEPGYVKALMRRSAAYEHLDDLEHALADSQKVLELDPGNSLAGSTVQRLTPIVNERREKMKEEMLGKLKDLGNTVLGKFGMSLDSFKMEKDPNTGSYSINFKQ